MPGLPPGAVGARAQHTAPPKPVTTPWISLPKLPEQPLAVIPPEPIAAWRSLWHALGSNLPFYINQSRANRHALNSFARTHG